ncbi:unnamed protein product, partial [Cyprideis torosa]
MGALISKKEAPNCVETPEHIESAASFKKPDEEGEDKLSASLLDRIRLIQSRIRDDFDQSLEEGWYLKGGRDYGSYQRGRYDQFKAYAQQHPVEKLYLRAREKLAAKAEVRPPFPPTTASAPQIQPPSSAPHSPASSSLAAPVDAYSSPVPSPPSPVPIRRSSSLPSTPDELEDGIPAGTPILARRIFPPVPDDEEEDDDEIVFATPGPSALLNVTTISSRIPEFDSAESQERIIELAKQESRAQDRLNELLSRDQWVGPRLSKLPEWTRPKVHQDFVLEEMQWMWNDFNQEKRIKRNSCKRLAKAVFRHFTERRAREERAKQEDEREKRRIAAFIAREIRAFWSDARKLVELRTKMLVEHSKKRAMDRHLTRVVETTEKYSSWLTEGLAAPLPPQEPPGDRTPRRQSGRKQETTTPAEEEGREWT